MKQKLLPSRLGLLLTSLTLCAFVFSGYGQQLKTSYSQNAPKGHQLYKQTKIFDNSEKSGNLSKPRPVGDNALDRIGHELNRLKNPYTGEIPENIAALEAEFSKHFETSTESKQSASKKGFSFWKNRGPFNVGGRTRALAIDNRNENIIFAGGVSGGLWRSFNAGKTWQKVTKKRQSPSITAIVQDPRPNKSNVWYYGTGERFGNSASGGGAFYSGTGVYKSINGGRNFKLLDATDDNDVQISSPFDIVNSMAIHPENGDLYVATFDGIHRSKDGGESFEEVLEGGIDNWTEVMITPSGKIYATIEFFGDPNSGFYTSDDGDTWTRISDTAPSVFNDRTVMAYDPSNENIVYFFANNLLSFFGFPPYLLKYDASAEAGSEWTNLSSNLPTAIGGFVGNLNLQGNYNMIIRVKPDDPNFIVLGGTNLYRSTTGFTTRARQESWIGGYSPLNDVSVYPDQHPDQHNLIFYPSNPNKVLSANDGGVHLTEDITTTLSAEEPVDWISLNNGYLTTQPYAFAFDPEGNSDDLIAGFQDNGTWFTNSTASDVDWTEEFGGDGSYNAIADGGNTRYVSSQRTNIYRLNYDDDGNFLSFARIRPAIVRNPGFINPFLLDPNNDNIMYLPDGNVMLRNSNLDQIPGGTMALATVNWVALEQTSTPDTSTITALDVSRYPEANKLYYGTSTGMIFKMDNANIDDQPVVDISTGKGLPPGYVSNITVDPSNSNRALVVFSNYGIPSVFLTEDAGETWTDVSGNLEENPDGSGNGPSVRWAAFFGNGQSYYVGTSTGLYTSSRLNGNNTKWNNEPFKIGNAVVMQVKTRSDGFVGIATHGNGLYSAKLPISPPRRIPNPKLSVAYLLDDFTVDLNSEDTVIDISGLFVHSQNSPIDITLTNSNESLVTATLEGNLLTLKYTPDSTGKAAIGLIATSGNETVSEGFTVTVEELPIYQQVDVAIAGGAPSQNFLDLGGVAISSDDFVVPNGNMWTINRVVAFGGNGGRPVLDDVTVIIYEDNGGLPGDEVYNSGNVTPISEANDPILNVQLPVAAQLEEGTYWLAVYANVALDGDNQWFWDTQPNLNGAESVFKDEADLFGNGSVDWTPASVAFSSPRDPADQRFQLYGVATDADNTGTNLPEANLAEINAEFNTLTWPNPSYDAFNFNISSFGNPSEKASILVLDLTGRLVYKKNNIDASQPFKWDASNVPTGVYLAIIQNGTFKYSGKLIKQ